MGTKSNSNAISITRIYDAPVDVVWDAWTDPEQVAQWWGPRGFTLTTHSKDLRVGGHWKYTMHGPDGVDYENTTKYFEVEPHSKLVYDHGGSDDRPPLFRVSVVFSAIADAQTKMEMTMTLPTPEAARETRGFIKKAGGDSTWDRLAEYLEKEGTGRETFVINRTFDAPVDVVFEMWTDPEHLAQWVGPTGTTTCYQKADIRPGGESRYSMSGKEFTLYGKVQYRNIEKPHTLVYTQQFCDEHGNISRHPLAPTWPETMLTNVSFAAEGEDQTRVTVTWSPFGDVTPEELQAFISFRASMTQGWTGSFDKLEAYLADR